MALTLRTDDELERALSMLAESEGTSRQDVIRRAVLEKFERTIHEDRVRQSATRMIEKWGDVIERLAKT